MQLIAQVFSVFEAILGLSAYHATFDIYYATFFIVAIKQSFTTL